MIQNLPASQEDLVAILTARLALGRNPGIAAALVTPSGTFQAVVGTSGTGSEPLSPSTLFEIGSITKLVTGVLFADSIRRGEVHEEERLVDIFPEFSLTENGEKITLLDLATHRSGLPRNLPDFTPTDPADPHSEINEHIFFDHIGKLEKLNFHPGTEPEYSNIGAGILGQALVKRTGFVSFEELMQKRFVEPLGLGTAAEFTTGSKNPEVQHKLATGHKEANPVSHWHLDYLAPAGGVVASLDAMTKFVQVSVGQAALETPGYTEIGVAIAEAQKPRRDLPKNRRIGYFWICKDGILYHNGQMGGFLAWIGCHKENGRAAVVMTNAGDASVDDIGWHLVAGVPLER